MTRRARWDLDRIHAKRYTDNVVDLLVAKLNRLPAETQQALQRLACLGNIAPIAMLAIVLGTRRRRSMRRCGKRFVRNWSSARTALTDLHTTGCRRLPIR